jgi:hypothetical protein
MIVEMTPMNQLICVVNEIVQQDGNGVQDNQITDAFQNGCSVMVKMIVGITVMKHQKIAQFAIQRPTSNVITTDVFQNNGHAILLTIVVMAVMKWIPCVKENIENVQNQNSVATIANVFQVVGVVIMKMIVAILVMSYIVKDSNVKMEHSSVHLVIVLLLISVVMVIAIVEICPMKSIVRHDSQEVVTVQSPDSNVAIIYVFHHQIFVMVLMTVEIIQMKLHHYVRISIVIH